VCRTSKISLTLILNFFSFPHMSFASGGGYNVVALCVVMLVFRPACGFVF